MSDRKNAMGGAWPESNAQIHVHFVFTNKAERLQDFENNLIN
jgi:hypothetical protein